MVFLSVSDFIITHQYIICNINLEHDYSGLLLWTMILRSGQFSNTLGLIKSFKMMKPVGDLINSDIYSLF